MKTLALLSLGLVLALTTAPATSQTRGEPRPSRDAAEQTGNLGGPSSRRPEVPTAQGAPGRLCIPWCPQDQNPCDPPFFKIADGRCSYEDR